MTADKLETFIDSLTSGPHYQNNQAVRLIVNDGIAKVRALIAAEKREEVMALVAQMAKDVRAAIAESDSAAELDPDAIPTVEEADAYMERMRGTGHFFGPREIELAFGLTKIPPDKIPSLPPWLEIERHEKLGHVLRLRVVKNKLGDVFSVKRMSELMQSLPALEVRGIEEIEAAAEIGPRLGWAFTTKGVLPSTVGETYPTQAQALYAYAQAGLYSDRPMPGAEKKAYDAFVKSQKPSGGTRLPENIVGEQLEASRSVPYRPSLADLMFDFLVEYNNTSTLPADRWSGGSMTSTRGSGTGLLAFEYSEEAVCFSSFSWLGDADDFGSHFSRNFPVS